MTIDKNSVNIKKQSMSVQDNANAHLDITLLPLFQAYNYRKS